ncbi:thermonuclease family protein [Candidatus Pacearchaeota archaeon]|nr:thermonuclease family protein [Candidatus Pacearchaeota archaeon]
MYTYKAIITRVVDGDTFDAEADLGFSIKVNHRFRLEGADTPETWRPKTEAERVHGEKATEFVTNLIEGKEVTLHTSKLGIYGRYDATVFINGNSLADLLIENDLIKLDSYPADGDV